MNTGGIDFERWLHHLSDVTLAMMNQRTLSELLSTILSEIRTLTRSDAGSIYRVLQDEDPPCIVFEESQNESIELPDQSFKLPLDRSSLAGYSAVEGEILNIPDVYELDESLPYSFDSGFDESVGYRTKSMLIVPLKNRDGIVRGVLQLINRKKDPDSFVSETPIEAYPESIKEVVMPFSTQAAIAIERAELDESIQSMVDSMIHTLVNALDKRDEITTGHSRRIAGYSYYLANAISDLEAEPWTDVTFDDEQIRILLYSGLLHDIGKIAVPESVLNKKNRLSDDRMEAIRYRLAYMESTDQLSDQESVFDRLQSINESGYLEEEEQSFLYDLRHRSFKTPAGTREPIINEYEHKHLSIKQGNLTSDERDSIEYHAKATFDILQEVDWTSELEDVPELAASHHEKLDGSGYPWGKTEDDLSLIARILAVVDVYEALTARDRPYRSAMEPEEAREILYEEAEMGHLDQSVVDAFFEEEIHLSDVEDLPDFKLF
ncbi:MAG: GAF and HD-GYP domain-containing protein [bacterium]